MHRITAIVLLLAGLMSGAAAQTDCSINKDNWQSLQLTFTVGDVHTAGTDWQTLTVDGLIPSMRVGAPQLPLFSRLIEVPLCEGFEVSVTAAEYDTLPLAGGKVVPAQPSRSKSDTAWHPMEIDRELYAKDAYYSEPQASVEVVGIARDRRLARLQFSPVQYNPVQGKLVVCRKATVTVRYRSVDQEGTLAMFERYHSPAFHSGAQVINSLYPKSVRTAAPVRYLIVAHSMFRGQLDTFVQWKRRKGFITDIVYTDDPGVGTTTNAIQSYIQGQYTNATTASPAPTYLLIVGDHEQIPAFTGTTSSSHITDLYYISWTSGDNIPDCYCGRFSAQTVADLTPQVQKTLMYEQYTFNDPTYLDRAVMVAGVDGGSSGDYGYTHADPAMDYAITNYINGSHGWSQVMYFKNNTSIVPTGTNVTVGSSASSNSATVRNYYNQGAGLINYSAHGSATSWGTPSFTTTNAAAMTNTQKFGLMIGNCCLTNKFQTATCLGESVLRKGNYCGAVGYIGGSNSTYWYEDLYWAVGVRSSIGPSMSMAYDASHLGVYDRVCHTHNEAYSQWVLTQGDLMFQGNMAVESSSTSRKLYYWEIYHLMGDPSVMTYLTQASLMTVTANPSILSGSSSYSVTAAPYAYVALTDTATHTLVAAAYANSTGQATLTLPSSLTVGGYELAASAQQYRTKFLPVSVIPPTGPYAIATALEAGSSLLPGTTVPLTLTVANPGSSTAQNVTVQLTPSGSALTLSTTTVTIASIAAGASATATVNATVSSSATDGTTVAIGCSTNWTGASQPTVNSLSLTVAAPVIDITFTGDGTILPAATATVNITIANHGHAPLTAATLAVSSPTSLLAATAQSVAPITLAPGASVTKTYTLQADASLPLGISIPLAVSLTGTEGSATATLPLYVGNPMIETFESGTFSLAGWTQGTYPWTIDTTAPATGTYCARSTSALTHSQTAELTIQRNVSVADSVSFWYKVSSESGYDKFHFYIDSEELVTASGEVAWTRAAFPVATGSHTFRFTYSKDGSVNRNSDCAWIDDVTLPAPRNDVHFSTVDLCQGDLRIVGTDTIGLTPGNFAAVSGDTLVEYTVHPTYTVATSLSACDSLEWEGTLYTADFNYSESGTTIFGCDSSTNVNVRIFHSAYDTIEATTQANNYHWHGETYTESGEYTITLTTAAGCDSVVTLILTFDHPHNGIADLADEALQAYPSPTAGPVAFSCEVAVAEVYDLQGRLMIRRERTSGIDLSALPQGLYLLRLTTEAGTATLRLERL